jgi:Uma2 family endonuclease
MSTLIEPLQPEVAARLFTAADLAAMPTELPSGSVGFVLDNGRLIVVSPPGNRHSAIQGNIVEALKQQGTRNGHGKTRVELGVVLRRNPDRVVGVDVAFITIASLPVRESPEGYLETIPDLMVEIRSKNDSLSYLQRKIADYLTAGAKVAWLVDAEREQVTVYRSSGAPEVLDSQQTLTLGDVIPGFALAVADVFVD